MRLPRFAAGLPLFVAVALMPAGVAATSDVSVTATSGGIRITATVRNETIERDELPVFDIAAFMADGAKGMKPGWYRLPARWTGRTRPARGTQGARSGGMAGIVFHAVKVNGPDDVVITALLERESVRSAEERLKTFGPVGFAFALKRKADFTPPPVAGAQAAVIEKYGREATPAPTGGGPGAIASGRTRLATFTDAGTLALTVVEIRSECSVVRGESSWKTIGYAVYEGVAKSSGMDFAEAKKIRENALMAYAERQPEALRKLILTLRQNPAGFDAARFVREADATLVAGIMAKSKRTAFGVTEEDAGVPKDAWASDEPAVLWSFNLFAPLGSDYRVTNAPDANTRRYLKLIAAGIPDMNADVASRTADEILRYCRTPKLVIDENGVRLLIEHFPDGSSSHGILESPAGKEREARELLRDRVLAIIDRS